MMKKEQDLAESDAESTFKGMLLANNPQLYRELYINRQTVDDEEIEFRVPQTAMEIEDMVANLKQLGLDIDVPMDNDFSDFKPPTLEDNYSDGNESDTDAERLLDKPDIE